MSVSHSKGFTLIEVLISLTIVLVLTAFFPILLKSLYELTKEGEGISALELDVFITQSKTEIRNAKKVETNGSILTITTTANQRVTYEFYQQKIRRRVNGSGHEILLQHVHEVKFEVVGNGAIFRVKGSDQQNHEFRISAIHKGWKTQ